MDDSSKDSKPLETKESAINNAEDTSFILGNGKLVTPHKPAAEVTPNRCMSDAFQSPLNFSTVTVEQLGITPESFVKNSSGKSSSYLKKSRRRSTVGVRGSPETNHLIRFIAQQRNLKNASLTKNSPCQGSPVLYRNVHSLREQISAFQSAFHSIKENAKMTDCPELSETEGEFKITGSTKKESLGECQQCEFPANLSSKRQRISSPSSSNGNLTDAFGLQIHNVAAFPNTDRQCAVETSANLSEKSSESGLNLQSGCLVGEYPLLSELTEASSEQTDSDVCHLSCLHLCVEGIQVADSVEGKRSSDAVSVDKFTEVSTDMAPEARSLVTPLRQRGIPSSETFVLRSVLKKPSAKLCLDSLQEHHDNLCDGGTHPSLILNLANCCKERKAEGQENCTVPDSLNVRKRKRVTFGEDLSPEVFDESLPANTPLRKGETPVRKKDLSTLSPLLLEQSPAPEGLLQPNFDDKGENLENIEPLQVSFAGLSPLSKSSISETLSGTDTFASSNNHEKIASCKVGRATRTSNRRSQLISFSEESVCNLFNTEAQPYKEKKINRRKSQESNRADRALPRKNQVSVCRRKKAKGKKKTVQKSLYGERDIASKKPLLSPIPELPEVSETPLVPSIWRMCSDDFNSNEELEEVKLPKRNNILPQSPEDWQMVRGFNKYDVSEFCSSDMRSSSSLINATFEQGSNTSTIEINENKNIPKAAIKLESENELKTETENENSHISCPSVTETPIVSDSPKPDFTMQPQELTAAGQNMENLFQIFKISEDINIKCENQDDFLVVPEGKLQAKHLMPDSQKECDCSEDVLIDHLKESQSQGEDLGRNSIASSRGVSYRERKYRRQSMACSDGQSLHLEKIENPKPSYSVSSSVEISLENSQLYKDLSDSIEQTFQRTKSETRVRRSTRLQKGLESEGLVWISLPLPPTSGISQRTKRRTIGTFDSRRFENGSSRQKPCVLPSTTGKENSEGFAAAAASLPGRRRKSFCTSTLADPKNTTQSRGYKRTTFLNQKEALQVTSRESDISEN
ncbi:cell division cycle-associated protein 2 isoform X1 [Lagenorhynchus albirostris]|uniref:cell division cycle-associated protein 2 isoform X1 n=1 Tax=Lagenorhynchus albirostris TaxID=27610 RepID=UPI0028EE1D74|nr:cell division cycle-associated protein 2 isoform X1 [Lagenorhynchus albirostris]XP_060011677.1 cell division cycle-associated protein 2 isoform X1 [Lagenorhynchus albirostris]